ncbi:MAG: hypothetical protein KAH10_03930 [Flavobacteriales bacterium]|nr:hypothetical protein [Flavobacteriales bacterium]
MTNPKSIKLYLIILVLSAYSTTYSQEIKPDDWGIKVGVSFNIGTHFQRIGLMFQGYYFNKFAQGNIGTQAFYNFRTLGPKVQSWEIVPNLGVHFYWGSQEKLFYNPEFSTISIQSQSPWSLGYSLKYYWDTKGTSQASGLISINLKNYILSVENDIFIGTGEDKYRTGTFLFAYHKDDFEISIATQMWHGYANKAPRIKETEYPANFGYMDLSNVKYGRISHGVLAIRGKYYFNQNQSVQSEIGIDSEKIRHFFQNKLIHDMPFVPKSWNKAENLHIPMLQEDGSPYLYGESEKVRKSKLYLQFGMNQPTFY